ncbi:hypothetical protein UPYG_G00313190 [Umbra pygmaea]|uniref:Myosin light chain kinase, smooth muscle n=1 Tax=Umbra pygmaea TaxID=75934 RepID=A0ABD0WME7_UMBPY
MGDVQLVTTVQISKASLILGQGSLSQEPPAFTLPPRNARVIPGGTACLDGKVRGHPEPQVKWFRNGKVVIAGDHIVMEQSSRGTFSLVIHSVQESDAGRYTCEAVNDAGSRQVTVEITVEGNPVKTHYLPSSSKISGRSGAPAVDNRPSIWGESPPKFVTKPSRIFVRVGQSGKFSAKITGRPHPVVTWLKGDEVIQPSSHFTMFEKSGIHFLEIRDACMEDAGTYTCSVANSAGKAMAMAELNVQGTGSDAGILARAAMASPVPMTTDPVEVKHTSNGLLVDQCSRPKTEDSTEAKDRREKLPSLSKETTDAKRPAGKAFTSSTKPPALLPDKAPRKALAASPKAASTNPQLRGLGAAQTGPETHKGAPEMKSTNLAKGPLAGDSGPSPEPTREGRRQVRESRLSRDAGTSEVPHRFDSVPQSQDALEGTKVTFKCQVSGFPVPVLNWVKDGLPLRPRGGLSFQQDGNTHTLTVDNVQKRDSGTYGCAMFTRTGTVSSTWTLNVKNPKLECEPPSFSTVLKGCSVSEGQDIHLQCSVEGKPLPNVSWLLNDKPIPDAHLAFEKGLAQLTVRGAVPEDGGQYTCVAENSHGRVVCNTSVIVKAKKSAKRTGAINAVDTKKLSAPVFLRGLKDLKVMDGSQVIMAIEVTGNPHPEVLWLHNGKEIQESEDFHFERKGNQYSLFIQEVFPEDTGKYTCEVWNEEGEARTEASLTVQEPQDGVQPWFITKPKSTTASLGQNVLLSCAIAGDPFPQWAWRKRGQVVSTGRDYEILQKEDVVSLLIRQVRFHHAGDYEISLRNKVGDCSCVATLLVSEGAAVSSAENRTPESCQLVGREDGTVRGRGAAGSSSFTQKDPEEFEEPTAAWGLLKRRVETKEHREDQIRLQEAEQRDFRTVLGRKVATKSVSEEDLKEITAEQMDFRSQLKGVKPKTLPEDDRKVGSPAQVDFRAMLGKKGGPVANSPKPGVAPADKTEPVDFKSVLANKKKQTNIEKNGERAPPGLPATSSPKPTVSSPVKKDTEKNAVNCVDGGIIDKKSNIIGTEPSFSQKLSNVTVVDGARLRLQCQVTSNPPANITWTLDGKVIKPSKFIKISNEGGLCSLTIDKALLEDEGQYKCQAENSAGKAECSCMVLVDDPTDTNSTSADKKTKKPSTPTSEIYTLSKVGSQTEQGFSTCGEARIKKPNTKTPPKQAMPPQIIQFPDDMKILAGEKVEILCKYGGAQPINCTWLKFRKPIQEVQGDLTIVTTEATSKLTIADSQQEHCGCYTIELRNNYGLRQAALNLTIVDKPDPPARVPAASDIRRSTLTLSWYGPTYDGGSAVTSYNLEIWNSVDDEWKELVSCNSTSYNVQNLLGQRQYKFRVRAVNMYGVGEPSAESEPVTMLEEDVEEKEEVEDDEEKELDYRDVSVRTDMKVKDLYDVEERLGTGKFGQVFKLVEKATKKVWAGKFIKAYSAKEKENVRQEILIMNSLHHPKLVQCIDAFEGKSDIVMVLEMISGGELFERIIDEDFELTEREVIKYMLQIVDGVNYIHKQGIVHLDLKPENIMCVNKTGSTIKLIDFGLARRLETSGTLKVLFGTPEFVAPEVINYEAISYPTDMWSIGVICYILVSGLSPFMGDNDNETLSNVTSATWDFEDDAFDEISDHAKDFITQLLKKDMKARLTCDQCYEHPWLKQDTGKMEAKKLSKERMKKYILRRKWQKTGHAVRAIGRLSSMAMLAGVSAKKGSPTEEDNQFLECLEYEEKTQVKPTFSSVIKDVEVVEGSAARFDCKIEGYPDPEVVWYKDDQPIKETRHFQIDYDEDGNCSLVISEVNGDDDAKYTVKAVNSLGEATCTAELLVEVMVEEEEEEEEEE